MYEVLDPEGNSVGKFKTKEEAEAKAQEIRDSIKIEEVEVE